MNSTKTLRIAIMAVIVFVLFQKLNQLLCSSWGFILIRNEVQSPVFSTLGYVLVGVVALIALFGLYKTCIERKNESNRLLLALSIAIIVLIGMNTGMNWLKGNYMAMDANEVEVDVYVSILNNSLIQMWIVEVVAGAIFIVKLLLNTQSVEEKSS